MLEIKRLYKQHKFKDIDLTINPGEVVSIECSTEIGCTLINLITGKEHLTSGEIYINNLLSYNFIKKQIINFGIVSNNEGMYERQTVKEYLKFYSVLLNSSYNYKEIMMKLGLLDIGDKKIKYLDESQKKRISIARERLKDLKLLILQDPIVNLDKDAAKIVLRNIEELRENGVSILNISVSFRDTILLGGRTYILDEHGLRENEHPNHETTSKLENFDENLKYKIEKIPAKVDDRILLFNPMEIDYIESINGVSILNIRGNKFTSTLSLNDFEERLKYLGFFRCHRSYLVNLQRVIEISVWTRNSYTLVLDDKSKSNIPLSKGRIDELKTILKI